MLLEEKNREMGTWLFRWRSYLPLVFLVIIIVGIVDSRFPHLARPHAIFWEMLCFVVSMLGLVIRGFTIGYTPFGTSGRNTKKQVAESLNSTGIYSIVRNPLYLGNFFMMLGVALYVKSWAIAIIFILVFWLYYERIIATEEHFLKGKFGQDYLDFGASTPAFIPDFSLWIPPTLKFSLKNVLKREYSGFFGVIVTFTALEILSNYILLQKLTLDRIWLVIFIVGLVIYITLRTIRKKTEWLQVHGR